MNKKIRAIGAAMVVLLWVVLAGLSWFGPRQEFSVAERRPLRKMPPITGETLLNGKFTAEFEKYSLDQFPMRDTFRTVKSLFHYYGMGQRDNNHIYLEQGHAAKLEYPMNQASVDNAMKKFNYLYDTYLKGTGSHIVAAIVPDKGYYLAEPNGYPSIDYEAMFAQVRRDMPWAEHVDLTDLLTVDHYYRTDTHWRQEAILPVAERILQAFHMPAPQGFTAAPTGQPFYGVYYGQAALPMKPDEITLMENPILQECTVIDHETGKTMPVYNMEKLTDKDPYETYLSGARALLEIHNPNAKSDRELIVFRDSFGSSLSPLLLENYKTVMIVDTRYLMSNLVGKFVDFHGQDVLFLYNTLLINSSTTLK